jgi:prepilin-type N-terminal cleavage/methylation domain-containing protein
VRDEGGCFQVHNFEALFYSKFVSPFPTRSVFTPRQRERARALTLLSNFRSPVSGFRSPVSKFSTSYFVISTSQRERRRAFTLLSNFRSPVSKFSTSYFLISTSQRERRSAFTLLELLVVIGIIAILMVLIAPAFTSIKSGGDVTTAANTIKGILDQACTYAKTNNTYTWVGFYEEDVSQSPTNPATAGNGRIAMSIVASKDGTTIYDPTNLAQQDLTTSLLQVGKLTKIDNMHLWTHTDAPSGTGSTFDTRPPVASTYCIGSSSPSASTTPFRYPVGNPAPAAQYTFVKVIQFSPRGEARINNSTLNANGTEVFPLQNAAEIGVEPTHGATVPVSVPANVVAVQFTGVGGNVTIYRK